MFAFSSDTGAHAAVGAVYLLQKQELISLEDAAIVIRKQIRKTIFIKSLTSPSRASSADSQF
jgi:uncharacterized membrane protein